MLSGWFGQLARMASLPLLLPPWMPAFPHPLPHSEPFTSPPTHPGQWSPSLRPLSKGGSFIRLYLVTMMGGALPMGHTYSPICFPCAPHLPELPHP